ncbi:class I SAM-dependent methyltransferase, partial [Myxococcota bacterium]|nr:class I SAM-dependent methyltransferase [Myxococcota bacterium]
MRNPSGEDHTQRDAEGLDTRRAALWSWVKRSLPPSGRVLDAGCGAGDMLRELTRRGYEVVGLEPSPQRLEQARALLQREWSSATLIQAPLRAGALDDQEPFDAALCLDVIEHIQHDEAALRVLAEALKPQGQLLLSVPAFDGLYGIGDAQRGHHRRYSEAELKGLITRAGLIVEELRFWDLSGVLPYLISERLLARPLADAADGPFYKRALRGAQRQILKLEQRLRLPLGLSLLARARRAE